MRRNLIAFAHNRGNPRHRGTDRCSATQPSQTSEELNLQREELSLELSRKLTLPWCVRNLLFFFLKMLNNKDILVCDSAIVGNLSPAPSGHWRKLR